MVWLLVSVLLFAIVFVGSGVHIIARFFSTVFWFIVLMLLFFVC